jgi:hypothetical protein
LFGNGKEEGMKDLFGGDTPIRLENEPGKRKAEIVYKQMLTLYGLVSGKKCKECKHFYFRQYAGKYPKCELSGCTGASRSSDWNSRWNACGKFEQS